MSDRMAHQYIVRTTSAVVSGLWTPQTTTGVLLVAERRPLALVLGGRVIERGGETDQGDDSERRVVPVTLGGLIIVGSFRQREPSLVVGHPELASGASVQRGETLYVSVAEAIYREARGESNIEIHLYPTEEDDAALEDLRSRARGRWDSDRLPDGWTRPAPNRSVKDPAQDDTLPEDLQELAERFRAQPDEGR